MPAAINALSCLLMRGANLQRSRKLATKVEIVGRLSTSMLHRSLEYRAKRSWLVHMAMLGGESLKIKILVSGDRTVLTNTHFAAAVFGNCQTQLLSPLAAPLVDVAADFNKPASSELPQHARFRAEARRIQARAARIQAGSRRKKWTPSSGQFL